MLALDCPDDWKEFEDSCYKVVKKLGYSQKFSWSMALTGCFGLGGELVSVGNKKEMDFVYGLSSTEIGNNPAWIGLAYRFQKEYLWSNGESFNSSFSINWVDDIPRNASENKCAEIVRNGCNLTQCCKKNKYFICERKKGKLFLG